MPPVGRGVQELGTSHTVSLATESADGGAGRARTTSVVSGQKKRRRVSGPLSAFGPLRVSEASAMLASRIEPFIAMQPD